MYLWMENIYTNKMKRMGKNYKIEERRREIKKKNKKNEEGGVCKKPCSVTKNCRWPFLF